MSRIYLVTETDEDGAVKESHLVRASSQAQAIRHLVAERFLADLATQEDLVIHLQAGKKVREATA